MDGWDRAAQIAAEESGSFLKLVNDGNSFVGAFCGEPHVFKVVFNQTTKGYEDYGPTHQAEGIAAQVRFKINVYVLADGTMKVWEMNKPTFDDLLLLRTDYPLHGWFFKVTRRGAKGDSKVRYTVLPSRPIDAADQQTIATIPLQSLANTASQRTEAPARAPAPTGNYPRSPILTIDPSIAIAIVGRLRALPRQRPAEFLAKFQIGQIRALPAASLPMALRWLEQFEQIDNPPPAPTPPPPEFTDPVDPFGMEGELSDDANL